MDATTACARLLLAWNSLRGDDFSRCMVPVMIVATNLAFAGLSETWPSPSQRQAQPVSKKFIGPSSSGAQLTCCSVVIAREHARVIDAASLAGDSPFDSAAASAGSSRATTWSQFKR